MFYYVYVLLSDKDKQRYIGCTDNLQRRYAEHNSGLVFSTKNRRPLKLIYYEACLNKKDAFMREKYLKGQWGYKYVNKRLNNFYNNL
ncbi:MAG: GIY-YIG nuclease family protein [Patescibacteria group bacterium]|nr:GIY-YIG nuclease family protein [Patescibacteria group bacterium]